MRIVALSWRDLAHPQAGGSELLVDKLLVGLAARGHEVALVCGGPVGGRPYPVHEAGGTYSQYIVAPWICATRLRRADILIDVSNGVPFFSPLWRRRPSVCLALHYHGDQSGHALRPTVGGIATLRRTARRPDRLSAPPTCRHLGVDGRIVWCPRRGRNTHHGDRTRRGRT